MTSTGPGMPDDYHSTILESGRDLFIAATHLDGEASREAQVAALEAIAQTVERAYHHFDPRGDRVLPWRVSGGEGRDDRLNELRMARSEKLSAYPPDKANPVVLPEESGDAFYDENMVLCAALKQGWGCWLYSDNPDKPDPDSIDERLARSVVGVTLAATSYCPNEDLGLYAGSAAAQHCVYGRYPWLVRDALWDLEGSRAEIGFPEGQFQISEHNVQDLAIEIDNEVPDSTQLWDWWFGEWDLGRPRRVGDQAEQPDSDTSPTPPWSQVARGTPSFRQGEMFHAILGPALTYDLVRAVSASGLQEGTLVELTASLQELQGRKYSEMLLLMASAAHATGIAGGVLPDLENEFPLLRAGYTDAGKQFGWEVVEALRRFGVDPSGDRESFNRWLQYAVKDLDLHWREISPDPEEDEFESEVSAEADNRPRRKPRLMDIVNRAAARSARALADRLRSRRRGLPPS